MSLEIKIMEQIKEAMRSKNEAALRTLRAIKAAIIVEKTATGFSGELSEADEIKMLNKMAKQRRDSLEIFKTQNRNDLADKEAEELQIIQQYLPIQLSPEELELEIKKIITEIGAVSSSDLGKVMGVASKKLAGKADGKLIAAVVKNALN